MLTNKSVAVTKYYGCDVQHPKYGTGKIVGILHSNLYMKLPNRGVEGCDIERCQLMLTPLSRITDEDVIEAVRICGVIPTGISFITKQSPLDKIKEAIMDFKTKLPATVVDFLRASEWDGKPKQAYDVDGLIGTIAIDVINYGVTDDMCNNKKPYIDILYSHNFKSIGASNYRSNGMKVMLCDKSDEVYALFKSPKHYDGIRCNTPKQLEDHILVYLVNMKN